MVRTRRIGATSIGEGSSEGGGADAVGVGWMNEGREVENDSAEVDIASGALSSLLLI